jgi:hypothetical protein
MIAVVQLRGLASLAPETPTIAQTPTAPFRSIAVGGYGEAR